MVIQMGRISDPAKRLRRAQGIKIRRARKMRGLTIAAVAERMSITPGAISQWENGRTSPKQHHQIELAKALDVEWSALFGLDEAA